MRAGTKSWRFEESLAYFPHLALFVRDALRLTVGDRPTTPPPLTRTVPDLSGLLDNQLRAQAGDEWTLWWEAVIGATARPGPQPQRDAVLDPPDWQSLDDHSALQRAVVAVSGQATAFADEVRGALLRRDGPPAFFAHQTLRLAVDNITAAGQLGPEAPHASAVLIDVRGPWWVLLRPGELLCSVDTALSSDRAAEALALAFSR